MVGVGKWFYIMVIDEVDEATLEYFLCARKSLQGTWFEARISWLFCGKYCRKIGVKFHHQVYCHQGSIAFFEAVERVVCLRVPQLSTVGEIFSAQNQKCDG